MKAIKTPISEMFLDEHGILHKTVVENCHISLDLLKESEKMTRQLTGGKKVFVLYDARNHFTITDEALEYSRKDIFSVQRMATAIVSRKTGIRIMVDYIAHAHKLPIPVKIFGTAEDAMDWLLALKKETAKAKGALSAETIRNHS